MKFYYLSLFIVFFIPYRGLTQHQMPEKGVFVDTSAIPSVHLEIENGNATLTQWYTAGSDANLIFHQFYGTIQWFKDSTFSLEIDSSLFIIIDTDLYLIEGREPETELRNQGIVQYNDATKWILEGASIQQRSGKSLTIVDTLDLEEFEHNSYGQNHSIDIGPSIKKLSLIHISEPTRPY